VTPAVLRVVLNLVVATTASLAALGAPRAEDLTEAPLAKKDAVRQAKAALPSLSPVDQAQWRARLKRRIGKTPPPSVNIFNKWTHEYLVFDRGDTQQPPAEVANKFLRCHFTNQPTEMDQRLVSVLLQAANKFHVNRVDVVSGFRDPKYNLTLRKKGHQVARNSEHTLGHAVDFRLPGIGITRLHTWARTLRLGGVGFYNHSRFIHVDVGRVRYWNGS